LGSFSASFTASASIFSASAKFFSAYWLAAISYSELQTDSCAQALGHVEIKLAEDDRNRAIPAITPARIDAA